MRPGGCSLGCPYAGVRFGECRSRFVAVAFQLANNTGVTSATEPFRIWWTQPGPVFATEPCKKWPVERSRTFFALECIFIAEFAVMKETVIGLGEFARVYALRNSFPVEFFEYACAFVFDKAGENFFSFHLYSDLASILSLTMAFQGSFARTL